MQQKPVHLIQRYNTAAAWISANPILLIGEIGIESDTGKAKFGDGQTPWSALDYFITMEEFHLYSTGEGMIFEGLNVLSATLLYDILNGADSTLGAGILGALILGGS